MENIWSYKEHHVNSPDIFRQMNLIKLSNVSVLGRENLLRGLPLYSDIYDTGRFINS